MRRFSKKLMVKKILGKVGMAEITRITSGN